MIAALRDANYFAGVTDSTVIVSPFSEGVFRYY